MCLFTAFSSFNSCLKKIVNSHRLFALLISVSVSCAVEHLSTWDLLETRYLFNGSHIDVKVAGNNIKFIKVLFHVVWQSISSVPVCTIAATWICLTWMDQKISITGNTCVYFSPKLLLKKRHMYPYFISYYCIEGSSSHNSQPPHLNLNKGLISQWLKTSL